MVNASVIIVGGGLAGLYAAHLLHRQGIADYHLLDVRERLGGRIHTWQPDGPAGDAFDLGATWYWPDTQPQLADLIAQLGLGSFEQDETADLLVERSPQHPASRARGFVAETPARRLDGGMGALIAALARQIPPTAIHLGQKVQQLHATPQHILVSATDDNGRRHDYRAGHVLLALPPRLAAGLDYAPALPDALRAQWRHTATWMAPHAKYLAIYPHAFWRQQGLSGYAHSGVGPLAEIHDASTRHGQAALFGFIGLPAPSRRKIPADTLRHHCRQQLARLFGPAAATPLHDTIQDWAIDPDTATRDDYFSAGEHPEPPPTTPHATPWHHRLIGIASEWSTTYPGYAAGALEAAQRGIDAISQGLGEG